MKQDGTSGSGVSFYRKGHLPDIIHTNQRANFMEKLGSRVCGAVSKALYAAFLLYSIHFHFASVASFPGNTAKSSWQQSLEMLLIIS